MGILTLTAPSSILNGLAIVGGGSGADNLRTPDPDEIFVSGSATSASIIYDFGSVQPFDSAFLGFTNLRSGSTWSLKSGSTSSGDGNTHFAARAIVDPVVPYGVASGTGPVHLYAKLASVVSARYVRLDLNQPAGGSPITAGILAINRCLEPTKPQELGAGRFVVDTASRERLPSGGFSFGDGGIKAGFQFTLGDLADDEVRAFYALAFDRGERRPFVLVEDPDLTVGLNERIRWCVFDRLEPWERRGAGLTRWSLRVEDWK